MCDWKNAYRYDSGRSNQDTSPRLIPYSSLPYDQFENTYPLRITFNPFGLLRERELEVVVRIETK